MQRSLHTATRLTRSYTTACNVTHLSRSINRPLQTTSSSLTAPAAATGTGIASILPSSFPSHFTSSHRSWSSQTRRMARVTFSANPQTEQRTLQVVTDAVEIIDRFPAIPTRLLITCEHASMRLLKPWKWPPGDQRLLGQHWSYDPGAADFARELAGHLPSVGLLARFSRLLCDCNRPIGEATMFRDMADGEPVLLNQNLTQEEIDRRLQSCYHPYHESLRKIHDTIKSTTVVAAHSFTPVYEGQQRTIEVGVLYNAEKDRPLAEKFAAAFSAEGAVTALNEPWSAKDGFMFAADQLSTPHTQVIMFEFRQDLIVQTEWRSKMVAATEKVLNEIGH